MKKLCNVVQGLRPVLLMIVVQIAFAGVNIFYKIVVNDGMSLRIIVAYRFLFATAFVAPLALILERNKRTNLNMTWTVLFQSFLCGLFGNFLQTKRYLLLQCKIQQHFHRFRCARGILIVQRECYFQVQILCHLLGGTLAQNFYLQALSLTSATFASAMANLVPAITFILAVSFGLERLNLGTAAGKAKIVGTLIGISGAMVLTFVKGKEINFGTFHLNLLHHQNGAHTATSAKHILGALFALASGISYALWLITQAKMSERYPCIYSSTALMSLWGAIQSTVFALCLERDWSQWRLGWNIRLFTAAYSGVVVSGVMVVVISWCIKMRGPLFASVFNPLMLVMVALAGTTMLNEKLHLGSIIGAVLIVSGLYVVIWGKSKEMQKKNQLMPAESPNESNTVEIVVSSQVEDKSNRNETHENGAQVDRDINDDGHEEHNSH
uniref:Auxin-induced protein 5NG4 n=1 Tax=Cajanus cajan TaxID=3821 RepID=A0A151T7Y7_CAJCA|nr:Auxin-induced protein 5NG4 [Cajanus cajan]